MRIVLQLILFMKVVGNTRVNIFLVHIEMMRWFHYLMFEILKHFSWYKISTYNSNLTLCLNGRHDNNVASGMLIFFA